MRWKTEPAPHRRTSDDAFRRPGGRQQSLLRSRPRRHHRLDRPERRRQNDGVQLRDRLLQADRRAPRARSRGGSGDRRGRGAHPFREAARQDPGRRHLSAGADGRQRDRVARQGCAHVSEHPPVPGHDRSRKPDGRAPQSPDAGERLHLPRPHRRCRVTARPRTRRSSGPNTGSTRSGLSTAPTIPPANCPMARSGGSRSRAPCAPIPCCSASTNPPRASTRASRSN